jgi:outer membrane protein OmpA-like peptidoglycan-associated protein
MKGDILDIPELIFDLSYPMRPQTNDSLDVVINFLLNHPYIIAELALHTDSRGSVEMNQKMSEYHAIHVCIYLHSRLQDQSHRVTCKGYGESHLLVTVEDIEKAITKEEKELLHDRNRRNELIVKEVK